MTAADLAKVLDVLSRVQHLDVHAAPADIGTLRAEAFIASLPIRHVLQNQHVDVLS